MFEHIQKGKLWKPKAMEINAMLDAARAFQTGGLNRASDPGLESWLNPVCIRVRNDIAADLDRYTIWQVGDPVYTMDDDTFMVKDVVFSLMPFDSSTGRMPCVVQQPLSQDETGLACITGPTLMFCNGGGMIGSRTALPDSFGKLDVESGPINLVHSPPPDGSGSATAECLCLGILGGTSNASEDELEVSVFCANVTGIGPASVRTTSAGRTTAITMGYGFAHRGVYGMSGSDRTISFGSNQTAIHNVSSSSIPYNTVFLAWRNISENKWYTFPSNGSVVLAP